ncbi:MAG: hypothetical protein IJC71_02035 [Clostridia bacterium]|nr:hypothetical protein [Clostridia bacterium]
MNIKETSAYIKGLADGANLDVTTPEGKIIAALIDLCGKMAEEIETLRDELDVAGEYIEEIDEDLGAVEEFLYDELDDDDDCGCDCCDCDDDDDCDCGCCCGDDDEEDDDDDDDEEEFYCAMCPNCGGKVYFDDTVNPEDVICPACQKPLLEDEEDEAEDL